MEVLLIDNNLNATEGHKSALLCLAIVWAAVYRRHMSTHRYSMFLIYINISSILSTVLKSKPFCEIVLHGIKLQ